MLNNEINVFMGDFESIKEYAFDGTEIWRASKLMPLYGYGRWNDFNPVIEKAMNNFDGTIIKLYEENGMKSYCGACRSNSLFDINLHFIPTVRIQRVGPNGSGSKELPDYYLTRLACYAIAMEADNRKPTIKAAKQYLLYSVLEAEKMRQQFENTQRNDLRLGYSKYENELETVYGQHGVKSNQYGYVKSSGDKGFYNNPGGTRAVKEELGIPNNKPLADYMPYETLINKAMANFNTKYGIINKNLNGKDECASEAYLQNKAQRDHMKEMTGRYPEETMPDRNITDVRKDMKAINQEAIKSLTSSDNIPAPVEDPRVYNLVFTYLGQTYTLGQWCYLNAVDPNFILQQLDLGMPFEEAIFTRPNGKISPMIIFKNE